VDNRRSNRPCNHLVSRLANPLVNHLASPLDSPLDSQVDSRLFSRHHSQLGSRRVVHRLSLVAFLLLSPPTLPASLHEVLRVLLQDQRADPLVCLQVSRPRYLHLSRL
jgi:hypothetical protein